MQFIDGVRIYKNGTLLYTILESEDGNCEAKVWVYEPDLSEYRNGGNFSWCLTDSNYKIVFPVTIKDIIS